MRRTVWASCWSLALVVFAAPNARAQGIVMPGGCWAHVLTVGDPRRPVPLPACPSSVVRTSSSVRVTLVDRVLRYEVDERFVNRGGALQEADYLFPVPSDAAFQDLQLSINGELVAGETMDAAHARSIYENIVRARRDPALVEWMGHGLVRARIFPIAPGEEKRVVLRFQSVARREGDALRIDYSRGGGAGTAGTSNVRDSGPSSFELRYRASDQYGAPYSPTHQLDVSDSAGGAMRVVSARGDASDVSILLPVRTSRAAAITVLPYAPSADSGFALITVTPPAVRRGETTPRDVTLVLDVSGSMSGRKIEQARAAGRQLLATLRPTDRFRLIDFSTDVRTFRDDFVAATPENVRAATSYLDALEANGGTNIAGALREALRPMPVTGRLPLVLFVTDGEATVGDVSSDHLVAMATEANARAHVTRRIFTFGLGSDVNVSFLEQLALDGRGTSQFVRPTESVERMVGIVADRLVDPVLTDVRVRIDGDVRLAKVLPAETSDVFADRDLVLLARYSGHGRARVVVDGNQRGTPTQWTSTVDFPATSRDNPFVARIWATQRIGFLAAEKRKNGGSAELDDEIRSLGERFGIPTEFTSYLVTEPAMVNAAMTAMKRGAYGSMGTQAVAAAAAAAPRDLQFEAAKAASAQRAVVNVSALDSMSAAVTSASTRRIAGRTFELRDSVWTDGGYHAGMPMTAIAPYSQAYFDVIARLPELRAVFAIGDRLVVAGRNRAIVVTTKGSSTLSAAELDSLVRSW